MRSGPSALVGTGPDVHALIVLRGISASARVPVHPDVAQRALDDDVARLLDAETDGGALRMLVSAARALGEPDVALPVQVQLGPARELGGAFTRDLRWWPLAGEHALSHFDGALRLRSGGERCLLELGGK